jgi:RNA polymerase sigma-70 factor (ECF subfamily)
MARPAFWKVDAPVEESPRLAHLDHDRKLVEAAQADPARFEALYRKYLAQVYSYAFYELRDHHEAEDATERTFLAALANLGRFEERARPVDGEGASTFRVWLFQIARNAVAERRRLIRRHPEASLDAALAVVAPIDVEAETARRDEAAAALRAVDRLPGDRRRALILRFVDEMSTAEIAGVLGRSEGAVRVLIHRALRSVARDLDGSTEPDELAAPDGDDVQAIGARDVSTQALGDRDLAAVSAGDSGGFADPGKIGDPDR